MKGGAGVLGPNGARGIVGHSPGNRVTGVEDMSLRGIVRGLSVLHIGLVLLVLMDVSRFMQHFPALSALRPALLTFAFCVVLAFLRPRALAWGNLLATWHTRAMGGIVFFGLLSIPFGISLGASAAFFLDSYSKVLATAFLILLSIKRTEHLAAFVWAYAISCGIWVLMIFTVFDLRSTGNMMRLGQLYMLDPNDVGLVLVVGIPITLWLYMSTRGPMKAVLAGLVGAIGMGIAQTGSRGAFLGLALTVGWLILTLRHVPALTRFGLPLLLVGGLTLTAPPGYWDQMRTIVAPEGDYNLTDPTGRKAIAERGVRYMAAYPVFGIGMNNFPRAEGTLGRREESQRGAPIGWLSAHNTYVQIGAELGPVALALWLGLIGGGVLGISKLSRRLPRSWKKGSPTERFLYAGAEFLPASFVGFAVCSLFLSFGYLIIFYILVVFMIGLHIQVLRLRRFQEAQGRSRTARYGGSQDRHPARVGFGGEPGGTHGYRGLLE